MVGLGNFQVFLIVAASTFMTIAQIPYCTPGEELQPYNLTLSITQNPQNQINWYKGGRVQIASCLGDVCDRPGVSVSGQTSTLMFANVTRQNATTYVCTSGKNSTCDLKVYAKARSVSCQQAVLQADTVTVVCTVTRIYPKPVCLFQWIINATENHIIQDNVITYNNLTGNGDPDYFNVNCSLKLSARNFSVGAHQFHVRVYPDVTGRERDRDYGIDSQTSPQTVAYPMPTLNCSETIVQEGKPLSCTCRETANTFIFPTTTLFYGSVQVGSALQQVTGYVTANRNTEELTCKAQLPDGTNANRTYTIQVAYGPSNVSLRVFYNQAETSIISLCDRTRPVTVTVTCSVPVNNVRPDIIYQFYSNVTDTSAGSPNMSARNYTVTSGGMFYFLCTGNNSRFPTLSATSTTKIIQVTEPPNPPVLEKYQDSGTYVIVAGNQLTVQEGLARIRCRAEGGYPPVSRLLLECGSQINTSMDNNLYMDVNMTRRMDGSNCSCTATHSYSCYRNNTALALLDVHFGPTIISFEANNSVNITVEKNSRVSFSCQAEGNPPPRLSLRKDGTALQEFNDPTRKFNLTLNNQTLAGCKDTGVYMCLAETGQTATDIKTVVVYVKCTQQFRYPDSLKHSLKEQVNGTVAFNVSVYGYPEPSLALNSTRHVLSTDVYSLTYKKQEPPYGTVSLMIKIKNKSFFQNYSLMITNSQGQLTHSFEIEEGDPVSPQSQEGQGLNVGAVVGGVIAGVLVVAAVVVVVIFLKRRGLLPYRGKTGGNADRMLNIQSKEKKGLDYVNISHDNSGNTEDEVGTVSQYENVLQQTPEIDDLSSSQYVELEDAQYETPLSPTYTNQATVNAKASQVEYENTINYF